MIGMLWFDDDPDKTLETVIGEAAAYYRKKYGADPNICMVNTAATGSAPAGITLRYNKTIRPNSLLIGVENGIHPGA